MSDPIIYILVLENGDVLAFRKKEDAEAEMEGSENVELHEAYLQ